MQPAHQRQKLIGPLAEKLPKLKVVKDKDQVKIYLSYGQFMVHVDVDDRVFNAAETDLHGEVVGALMDALCEELQQAKADFEEWAEKEEADDREAFEAQEEPGEDEYGQDP